MRISDWSSDVCSSDLRGVRADDRHDLGVDVLRIAEIDVAPCAASAPAVCTGNGRFQGRYRLPRPDVVDDRAFCRGCGVTARQKAFVTPAGDEGHQNVRARGNGDRRRQLTVRSEEHTSELQSLMRISYAVFCLTTQKT